jgi:DNA-binding NarL/FixJ family response regulator
LTEINADLALPLIAAFGSTNNPHEFCKQLVHKVMRKHSAIGALIGLVGNDSKCHAIGKFGEWQINNGATFDLQRDTPIADALKSGKQIHIETARELQNSYPEVDSALPGSQSYIFSPFESTDRAIGFLGIGFAQEHEIGALNHLEIQMITVAAEYVSLSAHRYERAGMKQDALITADLEAHHSLTGRQLEILQQMSEGKTNVQIGRHLNLSESSIKQESVKIFRMLGVNSRLDASDVAKRNGLI